MEPKRWQDTEMLKPHGQCYLKPTVGQMFIFQVGYIMKCIRSLERRETINWNELECQLSDEYMLKGGTLKDKKQYYERLNNKLDQEILAKAKEDGFGKNNYKYNEGKTLR